MTLIMAYPICPNCHKEMKGNRVIISNKKRTKVLAWICPNCQKIFKTTKAHPIYMMGFEKK